MPVERSKAMKRSPSAGNEFVWTSTAEPTPTPPPPPHGPTGSEVSFALSPWSFDSNTPPPLVDAVPAEFIMFPPPDESASSGFTGFAFSSGNGNAPTAPTTKRQPHSKKKPVNHIPRPPNAFILFRSAFVKSQHVSTAVETNHSTLSKIIGIAWQKISEEERQVWHDKAKLELEEHKRKFPKYAFKPVQTKAKAKGGGGAGGTGGGNSTGGVHPPEKRKVREVEPKDMERCAKIAQLIVDGSKGDELIAAVEEFDKHHVPEIVTRFEAPITAHAFRRSSSVPMEDTEKNREGKKFLQKDASAAAKRKRCVSTKRQVESVPMPLPADVLLPEFTSISGYPTLDAHTILPLKEEPLLSFDNFSFENNITRPPSAFACDPLTPGLEIDTYTSTSDDWSNPPSPTSPSSPTYMMSPSPILSAPATPTYSGSFDSAEQHDFGSFEFSSMCGGGGIDTTATMDCGGGIPLTLDMSCVGVYSPYEALSLPAHHLNPYDTQYAQHSLHQHQHQQASSMGYFDFDFSAFVEPIPQYAM